MNRTAFVIINDEYDEVEGYRVCTVHEGIKGYYETTKFVGQDWDLAKEYVQEMNAAQGLSLADVEALVNQALEK